MANFWPGDPSHPGIYEGETSTCSQNKPEEGGCWYYSRREIEEHSPSKLDGIDMKKETYLRKSYCTFLQDLGMRLKVPQLTIATAIIFCHRFFLRQSHARNDRRTIATACMFLAGKVEETPRPLKDVILVSYEIIHKKDKDPNAVHRIKQKEVYEQQKELILLGERVVLSTLDFDLNVLHPYKPLVEAIRKFKVAQNALAQVAWNFVNDGLRTSLCLQFKPHHIAAGAIFLAAKFLKVKLPSDGERVWWQEFDVTPRQLEEVSNQMLELYEQNRVPPSQGGGDAEGSAATGVVTHRASSKAPSSSQEYAPTTTYCSQASVTTSRPGNSWLTSSKPGVSEQSFADSHCGPPRSTQNLRNDQRHMDFENHIDDDDAYGESKGDQERSIDRKEKSEVGGLEDTQIVKNEENKGGKVEQSTKEAIKKIDREKVKAALEKRRKTRVDITRKTDVMDEDDLIERELEAGIELASETQMKQDNNRQSSRVSDLENVEEGEVSTPVDLSRSSNHKRKAEIPLEKTSEGKQRSAPHYNHYEYAEDQNQNRHLPENHV